MNIVVLGAGAVGGYFGGKLAKAGYPTTFLVREKRFNQLKSNGLKINSINGDFLVEPTLAKNPNEITDPDLVIVALKNYHLNGALPIIKTLVENGAKVLPLLNGIHHVDLLVEKFGQDHVLGGLCYIESTLNDSGEVVQTSQMQDLVYGALSDSIPTNFLTEIKEMFEKAEVNVTHSEEILEDMWKKYIFLASLSGITAAVRQPIGVSIQDEVTFSFLKDLITEVYTIAKARGIKLSEQTVTEVVAKMKGLPPTMTASMHRDLKNGLPIELDSLHGALLQMATKLDIEVPSIRAVYTLLHPYLDGKIKNE
jgi:2-dehydropantoate 2-reductase